MIALTWDAATGSGGVLHAVAGWDTGVALCGATVYPVTTVDPSSDRPGDIAVYRPRCRRCLKKETSR